LEFGKIKKGFRAKSFPLSGFPGKPGDFKKGCGGGWEIWILEGGLKSGVPFSLAIRGFYKGPKIFNIIFGEF